MAKSKFLLVFFDIETLQTNTSAENPKDRVVREYSVSVEYRKGKKELAFIFPSLKAMMDHLLGLRNKYIRLIAHNGRRFDNHFFRRTLIDEYGLVPVTGYKESYIDHEVKMGKEYKGDDLKESPNLLIEYRIKAKTSLDMEFLLNGKHFVTEDSYPHFQCSIKTLGELLVHHEIIGAEDKKLAYKYDRYDRPEKVDDVRAYCTKVFECLTDHERHYVRNDTHILRMAWENYETLFPGFDIKKRTLSLNILAAYNVNPLAQMQLTNTYMMPFSERPQRIEYSDFTFAGDNLFGYLHRYYHGGLNFYNDKKVGKIVHNLVHIDINSSYPTVMHNELFPSKILGYVDKETTIKLDKDKYYLLEVPVRWVTNNIIKRIKSTNLRKMIVKYFPSKDGYVYLQSPHIELFSALAKVNYDKILVKSALVFDKRPFGGRRVIAKKYEFKTKAKQEGWSKHAVYVTKVILNGIYGIPALRAYFNVFKYDNGELTSHPFGYKNTERNILFAASVTAYAVKNLLMPLSYNVEGLDKGYVYTDTDSHFLTKEYWETIKDHVDVHPTNLGAWDMEHKHIKSMYVLNHKKYCLLNDKDEIEVFCGGIPKESFNTDVPFVDFVKNQFSDGVEISNLKNTYTHDGVICLYMSKTKISIGKKYPSAYSIEYEMKRERMVDKAMELVIDGDISRTSQSGPNDEAIYFESELGSFGMNEIEERLYNIDEGKSYPIDELIRLENIIYNEINHI